MKKVNEGESMRQKQRKMNKNEREQDKAYKKRDGEVEKGISEGFSKKTERRGSK